MGRGEPLIRQWNLLRTLQGHRYGITTDELAGRLECSRRQVQRDLAVLQTVGFPLEHERRDFGKRYWRLAGAFLESDRLPLALTELLSLALSRELLGPLAGTQIGDGVATALEKIQALLPPKALAYFRSLDGTLLVKAVGRCDHRGQDGSIALLHEAVLAGRVLQVRYHSASQDRTIETALHPYGLVVFGTNLYCIGHLEAYGEIRTLKVTRFRQVVRTSRRFQRPADFRLAAYTQGSFGVFTPGRPQRVRVRFTGWAAVNVREQSWHPSQQIVQDAGGEVVAVFELAETTEFKRWLLGFGRHAVVLAPRSLAAEVAAELVAAMAPYEPAGKPARHPSGATTPVTAGR